MTAASAASSQSSSTATLSGGSRSAQQSQSPASSRVQPPSSTARSGGASSSYKRAHSPDIPVAFDGALADQFVEEFGQGPSKSASSPSTRERTQYILPSQGTPTAGILSNSLQQTSLGGISAAGAVSVGPDSAMNQQMAANGVRQTSPSKSHQRSATTGSVPAFSASGSYAGAGKEQQQQQQQLYSQQQQQQGDFRIPSHSGSTTSGFSAGSTGSSYDSVISMDNSGLTPGATGLGVVVEGAAYTSPSPGQTASAYGSSAGYAQIPSTSTAPSSGYYAQPYGYQPQANVAYAAPATQVYSGNAGIQQAFVPAPQSAQIGSLRRSVAGQSTGGSSYQSGASNSPMTGVPRRSQDFDGAFISPVQGASSQVAYGNVADTGSPAVGAVKYVQQAQPIYAQAQMQPGQPIAAVQGSSNMAYTASEASSVAQPYYAPSGQDYQSVVDQIMAQSRKGTDYGLDLGDFEMLDTLGTGTFGRVLLVRFVPKPGAVSPLSAGMPHYFAMKVLTKTEVVRLKQVEHINCERSILGAVDNAGIVNLFCTFQDSLNIYMLLEFVQGGELFSHLRRAVRFSADVSRFYAANIILVLEYLHNRNLIYRDLKPENLLLDSQGYLKVTDFGFAKYVPDRTFTLCGTPEYLAPEIINSAGHGKAADWWAFGVLLFEMLCGYPPFFDESPWGIYEKILAGNFSFPPHVDPVARDLVRRLLSSDRSKRLGNLRNGAQDVKNHQWFEGVDWSAVERRIIPAPIIPRIKSTSDSQNFERYPSIPLESLPGLAKAKGYQVKEAADPYEHLFTSF